MDAPKWTVGETVWAWVLSLSETVVLAGVPATAVLGRTPKEISTFSPDSTRLSSVAVSANVIEVSPALKATLVGSPE